MLYLSLKALHLVALISWMAGMLYLPRLFVYHSGKEVGTDASETFKVMERRLSKAIMAPALVVTWIAGIALWHVQGLNPLTDGWFAAKLICVLAMTGVHMHYLGLRRAFNEDKRPKSETYFRVLNEVPTLLLIAIIIFVVLKPF